MCNLTSLAQTLQTLLTTEAEQAARQTGCVRRVRILNGATFVQTLVLGWLHQPDASLDALAEFAADLGADLTPQALDQRLTPRCHRLPGRSSDRSPAPRHRRHSRLPSRC